MLTARVLFVCAVAVACAEPEPTPVPEAPPPEVPAPPPPSAVPVRPDRVAVVAAPDGAAAADVELYFHGLSELYRGFFSDPAAVGALGRALGPCDDRPAPVAISWDNERRIGSISLRVASGSKCTPVLSPDGVDLAPVVPLGVALAAYRDRLASSFDVRLASFRVSLQLVRGTQACILRAEGDHPPSGTVWSPCFGPADGSSCAAPGGGPTWLPLAGVDAATRRLAEACFGG